MTRMSFSIPPDLAGEVDEVLEALRGEEPRRSAFRLVRLVQALTETGLEAYFLTPVLRMGVNPVARQSVRIGLAAATRAVFPIMKRILESLSDEQLRRLAESLEEMLVDVVEEEAA